MFHANSVEIFIGITMNLQINLGRTDFLIIFSKGVLKIFQYIYPWKLYFPRKNCILKNLYFIVVCCWYIEIQVTGNLIFITSYNNF